MHAVSGRYVIRFAIAGKKHTRVIEASAEQRYDALRLKDVDVNVRLARRKRH